MSAPLNWIGAQAEAPNEAGRILQFGPKSKADIRTRELNRRGANVPWAELKPHNFGAQAKHLNGSQEYDRSEPNQDLWIYRDRSVALLRRYMRFSLETGRLPSMVGREFFRAKVSSYRTGTFEDRVIFVHDVERCIERLDKWDQELIARVILQEHSRGEAARILHCCRKTVERRLSEVLDLLSQDFLRAGLLVAIPANVR